MGILGDILKGILLIEVTINRKISEWILKGSFGRISEVHPRKIPTGILEGIPEQIPEENSWRNFRKNPG